MRLNGTGELTDDLEYPATSEELIETHGDLSIELQNGTETLAEVLGRLGDETFDRPEDVRAALLTGVSHKAIGRRYYSDREPPALGDSGPDQVSF